MAELFGSTHLVYKGSESLDLKSTVNFQVETLNSVPKTLENEVLRVKGPVYTGHPINVFFCALSPCLPPKGLLKNTKATVLCIRLQSWWTRPS